jgi:4-amino-4-deoxy-L-arabinose transferase-like glycosyltransferase
MQSAWNRDQGAFREPRETQGSRRLFLPLGALIAGGALWIYGLTRAATLSFTYDESLSYSILAEDSLWWKTTNNHVLNTLLMKLCWMLFGDGEFSLRLPNVLAHAGFLLCSYRCLCVAPSRTAAIAGFLFMNTNPFVLDFFSLARGYGLSYAFMLASLLCLLKGTASAIPKSGSLLLASFSFSALATWSSFSLLNFHLALMFAVGLHQLLLHRASSDRAQRQMLRRQALHQALLNAGILATLLPVLIWLKIHGQLELGGRQGLISDTLLPMLRGSLYSPDRAALAEPVLVIAIAIFCAVVFMSARASMARKRLLASGLLCAMVLICISSVLCQHHLLGTPFPPARSSLYLVPLFALAAVTAVQDFAELSSGTGRRLLISTLLVVSLISAGNLAYNANLRSTFQWHFDASTKDMIEDLRRDYHGDPARASAVTLGLSWRHKPATYYYRSSRRLAWLEPPIDDYWKPARDYYYLFQGQYKKVARVYELRVLMKYPSTRTVLAKRVKRIGGTGSAAGRPTRVYSPIAPKARAAGRRRAKETK